MVQTLLDSLNIQPVILLLNGGLFLVTLAILNFVFWQPMVRHLERRKAGIADAYTAVDETRREMERLREEYQARVDRIEADARGRIQQTVREAQHERERMVAEARAESERIVREGVAAVAREKAITADELHDELDDAALRALSRVTGITPTPEHRALVDDYIMRNVVKGA